MPVAYHVTCFSSKGLQWYFRDINGDNYIISDNVADDAM
jgi:hypothetical protein